MKEGRGMRRWWLAGLLGLGLVALAGPGRAQTTTTSTTTTTLVEAVPAGDGYFFGVTTNLALPNKGQMMVYADTRSGSLTVTLPPTGCGCKVGIAKLYDDNLVHVVVADVATEGAAPPPFVRVTSFDLDSKAAGPVVFVSNASSKTWFLGF